MRKKRDVVLDRISIKLEHNCKEWYNDKSATYGMPMAVYMQYVLTQFYENQMNTEAVRNLSALNQDGDLKDTNKALVDLLTAIQNSEAASDRNEQSNMEQLTIDEIPQTKNSKTGKNETKKPTAKRADSLS